MKTNEAVHRPTALAVYKRGRWCVVAKLTTFEDSSEPILAVVWRRQRGTRDALSMPLAVLDYAKRAGVKAFYLRDDRKLAMWHCDLTAFDEGRLRNGEMYIPFSWLRPAHWREWRYAGVVVHLGAPDGGEAAYE